MMIRTYKGDCLEIMKSIPENSIDLCLTDPPYGTTACKWDTVIPFEPMWKELHRVVKDNGAICLFGSEPFSSALRMSNIKRFKYDWVWEKSRPSNLMLANKMPLKYHELISVFSIKPAKYYPILWTSKPMNTRCKTGGSRSESIIKKNSPINIKKPNTTERKPKSILKIQELIGNSKEKAAGKHPTQKPVALLEYLIKTYTLENETVLDFTMGSGSTGVAAKNLNRKFIGIERDNKYYRIAKNRLAL